MKYSFFAWLLITYLPLSGMDAQQELVRVTASALQGKTDQASLYSAALDNNDDNKNINALANASKFSPDFNIPADVDMLNPLVAAIIKDHPQTVRALFKLYPNTIDASYGYLGQTPLFYAASGGNPAIVKILLTIPNLVINQQTSGKTAAIHMAALKGYTDIVRLLIDNDALLDLPSNLEPGLGTPLEVTKDANIKNMLETALDRQKANPVKLLIANIIRNKDITKQLLTVKTPNTFVRGAHYTGTPPNAVVYTLNPLSAAAFLGNNKALNELLNNPFEQPIDVNATYPLDGMTPLHWAVMGNNAAAVQALLDRGANPNLQDNQGQNPLGIAQKKGFNDIVNILNPVTGAKVPKPPVPPKPKPPVVKADDSELISALNELSKSLELLDQQL